MYKLNYYRKLKQGFEDTGTGETFRLRRNALHFMREILKECYIENGYAVEDVKNGLNCYKSKKNAKGVRETIETRIRIEKI